MRRLPPGYYACIYMLFRLYACYSYSIVYHVIFDIHLGLGPSERAGVDRRKQELDRDKWKAPKMAQKARNLCLSARNTCSS